MDHGEKAQALFEAGYNCSQAVAVAFCDMTGIEEATMARLASGLGGGMGRLREVCGGISGAILVLGLLQGYDTPGDDAAKARLYTQVQRLVRRFREKKGTILCRELLDNPSSDPTPTPRTPEFYRQRPCGALIRLAAEELECLLAETEG